MSDATLDYIIVGQGLAGTTLAWTLTRAGQTVLVIDNGLPSTSSKIAAGLITPITGQRMAPSWRINDVWPAARTFYSDVELATGTDVLHDRIAIRLFASDQDRMIWSKRASQPAIQAHLINPQPTPLIETWIADAASGGFAMKAAQLDVAAYLNISRQHLNFQPMTLDWQRDVTFHDGVVSLRQHRARHIISCEGFAASLNPYFQWVQFSAAKGDILTVRFERPLPPYCVHSGIWMAPTSDPHEFRVGSSYDREALDHIPSDSARTDIEQRLRNLLRVPFNVIDHQAAVRPILSESKARIGLHPDIPQLGYFNGLGSKGSLNAPWFAARLMEHMVHGTSLPDDVNVQKVDRS